MKGPLETARTREYPHLIWQEDRRLVRTDLIVGNERVPGIADTSLSLFAVGTVDPAGRLTPAGRNAVLKQQCFATRQMRARRCIVWAIDDCTWIDPDGTCTHDVKPPEAEHTLNSYRYGSMPIHVEHCWTIALPAGCRHGHLCIVPIDARRVEIVGGEPLPLGSFDEPAAKGERDPAQPYLDADGGLRQLARFRGQPVTAIEDWTLYGPVQPVGDGVVLRDPWPSQVAAACETIAGRQLHAETLARAWRAVRPDLGYQPVGVLRAA